LRAGRYPQAFDLARQFHAQQPSDASLAALRDAFLGQANHLLQTERIADLRRHLDEAEKSRMSTARMV
jgi:hypothetical protein